MIGTTKRIGGMQYTVIGCDMTTRSYRVEAVSRTHYNCYQMVMSQEGWERIGENPEELDISQLKDVWGM